MANGIFLGGVAKGLQAQQESDQNDRALGIKEKLFGLEQKKAQADQDKALIASATTNFKDMIASGKAIKQNAADPTQASTALGILRDRIMKTGAMLAQIPGGAAAAQTALDQFDADVLGTPTAEEAGGVKGRATAAEVTAAQPAQTAAKVAEATALSPVQAQAAAASTAASTGARLMTEANFAPVTAAAQAQIEKAKTDATAKPQTDAGKAIADRQLFVNQYGEGSPQVKAFDEAASATPKAKLSDIGELRGQYTKLSANFVTMRNYFSQIANGLKDPSPAGDLSIIFGYMKMLDPTSVVREGEQEVARQTGAIPDRVFAAYTRAVNGQSLAPDVRKDFSHQAENIFRIQLENQKQVEDQYRGIAERHAIDPSDVVVDFIGQYRKALKSPGQSGGGNGLPRLSLDGRLQ